jgi:hypothetical protein
MIDDVERATPKVAVAVAFASLVLLPFLNFAAENIGEAFDFSQLAAIALVYLAASVAAWALLSLILRGQSVVRAATLVAISSITLFSFGVLYEVMFDLGIKRYFLSAWGAVFVTVTLAAWFLARGRKSALVLAVAGVVMISVPSARLVLYALQPSAEVGVQVQTQPQAQAPPKSVRTPNVYFIVLDGYARDDVLRSDFQHDNGPLLRGMEARGFFVADRSMANFPQTEISLGSTLSMNYLLKEGSYSRKQRVFSPILGGANKVVRRLRAHGYSYIQAPPGGWQGSACRGIEDHCIRAGYQSLFQFTELQVSLMRTTPVYRLLQTLARRLGWGEIITYDYLDLDQVVARVQRDGTTPFYLFAHIMAPHPPYQYHADCTRRPWIGVNLKEMKAVEKGLYLDSVKCLNSQLGPIVDAILAKDADPIIIIQSDHGSSFRASWDRPLAEWKGDQIRERFGILNVTLFPHECRRLLYKSFSPVNTFRMVFSCIEGRDMSMLPDKSYLARYGHDKVELISER